MYGSIWATQSIARCTWVFTICRHPRHYDLVEWSTFKPWAYTICGNPLVYEYNWTITTNTNRHPKNYNLVDCSTFKPWAYHFSAWRPPSFLCLNKSTNKIAHWEACRTCDLDSKCSCNWESCRPCDWKSFFYTSCKTKGFSGTHLPANTTSRLIMGPQSHKRGFFSKAIH